MAAAGVENRILLYLLILIHFIKNDSVLIDNCNENEMIYVICKYITLVFSIL